MKYIIALTSLFAVGCAGHVLKNVSITSTPPGAPLDLDGVRVGETPFHYQEDCGRKWVGVLNSQSGWRSESKQQIIEIFPSGAPSQRKILNACQMSGDSVEVVFDSQANNP